MGLWEIISNFGNYTNKVGNFQIGWERLREFCHWVWEFLHFGSSHTGIGFFSMRYSLCIYQSQFGGTKNMVQNCSSVITLENPPKITAEFPVRLNPP